MTYTEITEALREAEREPQQTTEQGLIQKKKSGSDQYFYLIRRPTRYQPEPKNKTRNLTRIFSDPPKTCRVGSSQVGFPGGSGPCSVLIQIRKSNTLIDSNGIISIHQYNSRDLMQESMWFYQVIHFMQRELKYS